MIVEPAEIIDSSVEWTVLEITKACWVVLPKAEFVAALKRGRAWKRAAALRARQPDAETSADVRRAVKEQPCAPTHAKGA